MEETPTLTLPYTIVPLEPVQVFVKPNCAKWNLAQPDYLSVISNPITTSGENGFSFTAVARCLRTDAELASHIYYLEDANTPHGWDANDCVIEIAQVKSHKPPTGALEVPVNTEPLELVVSVMGFSTKTEAAKDVNAKVALPEGEYLLFETADNGMQYVGKSRGGIKYWINPEENVLPEPEPEPEKPKLYVGPRESSVTEPEPVEEPEVVPEPEPIPDFTWKDSYVDYGTPRHYVANIAYPATNIDPDTRPVSIMVKAGDDITVYGYFYREGIKFYRLHVKSDVNYELWVALPFTHKERAVLVSPAPSWLDKLFHRFEQTRMTIFPVKVDGEDQWIDNVKNDRIERIKK